MTEQSACCCLFEDGVIVRTDDLCPLHSKRPGVRSPATYGPWIPVAQGFLCDPNAGQGQVVLREGVAYWLSSTGDEYVLDLTEAACAEADRRNHRRQEQDFEWCDVRWRTPERRGDHSCANHTPGHTKHVCCCGKEKD